MQEYTTAYDGSKILRKNCIHMVSQAKGAFISGGSSGYVERLKDGSILKTPHPGEEASCEMEGKIYELLGRHNRLVPMLGYSSAGLNLEYMEN